MSNVEGSNAKPIKLSSDSESGDFQVPFDQRKPRTRDWVKIGQFKDFKESFQQYQDRWQIFARYSDKKRLVSRIDLNCREHGAKQCPLRIQLIRKKEGKQVVAYRDAGALHDGESLGYLQDQIKRENLEAQKKTKMGPRRARVLTRGGNLNMTGRYMPRDHQAVPPIMTPWQMKIRGSSRPQRVRGSPKRRDPNVTRFYNQPSSDSEGDSGSEWTPSAKCLRKIENRQSSCSPRLRIALDEVHENDGNRPSSPDRNGNNDPMSEGESGIGTQSQERSGSSPNVNGERSSNNKTNTGCTAYDGDMPTSLTLEVRKIELFEEVCDSMETSTKMQKELLEGINAHLSVMKYQMEIQRQMKEQKDREIQQKDQELQIMMEMLEMKKKKQASLDELVEIKKRKFEQLVERKQQAEITDAIRNFTIALSNEEMGGVPVTVNENLITVSVTEDSGTGGDKEQEQVPSDLVDE